MCVENEFTYADKTSWKLHKKLGVLTASKTWGCKTKGRLPFPIWGSSVYTDRYVSLVDTGALPLDRVAANLVTTGC